MTREEENFSKEDYQIFMNLCKKFGMKQMQFDRFKNNQFKLETVDLEPIEKEETSKLTLVR